MAIFLFLALTLLSHAASDEAVSHARKACAELKPEKWKRTDSEEKLAEIGKANMKYRLCLNQKTESFDRDKEIAAELASTKPCMPEHARARLAQLENKGVEEAKAAYMACVRKLPPDPGPAKTAEQEQRKYEERLGACKAESGAFAKTVSSVERCKGREACIQAGEAAAAARKKFDACLEK